MKDFIKRYELPSFFLLAYLLSWLTVPFMQGGQFSWGVGIAARIVIGVALGIQGVREYHKRVTNWRAGWWYLIAPLIVIAYTGIGFGANLLFGANLIAQSHISLNILIMLVLFGGQWEELGWTGYALPRLQERFADRPNGKLIGALTLSVFRAIWHLPLFLYGKMYWFDILIFTFAFQIIIAWVFDRSGSVSAVMALHFTSNIMGALLNPVFVGAEQITYIAIFILIASLLAVTLVALSQFKTKQAEALTV